jgi:hypothetical protein
MRSRAIALMAGAAALLLGAACSGDGDDDATLRNQPADGSAGTATTTPADDDQDTGADERSRETGERSDEGDGRDAGSLGSTTGQLRDRFNTLTVPLAIEVTGLERNGDHVELQMTMTVDDEDPGGDYFDFCICDSLADTTDTEGVGKDLSGVRLIDQDGQMAYLPIVDSAGVCVCSNDLTNAIQLGGSVELSATFGGLPADVETVDLEVPGFAPLADLAIQG